MLGGLLVLIAALSFRSTAAAGASNAHVTTITAPSVLTGQSCAPNSWKDYELTVTSALANSNLMFEVIDTGTAYRPTGLEVSIWSEDVPTDRSAEHKTTRAVGKIFGVGMCVRINVFSLLCVLPPPSPFLYFSLR